MCYKTGEVVAVDQMLKEICKIDILINNAGLGVTKGFTEKTTRSIVTLNWVSTSRALLHISHSVITPEQKGKWLRSLLNANTID